MKFITIIALFLSVNCFAQPKPGFVQGSTIDLLAAAPKGYVYVENGIKKLYQSSSILYTAEIRNEGTTPLQISKIITGCPTCISFRPDAFPSGKIAPNATATIKFYCQTIDKPGQWLKTIAIFTNASETPLFLTVNGMVGAKKIPG